jgi:hypothetical protein
MAAPGLARVAVRHVHLDHREGHGLDAVVQRDAVLGESARVDDGARRVVDVLLHEVEQRAFVIRLEDHQLAFHLARERLQLLVDLREGGAAVDVRLAAAEEVQIGSVQDEDLHDTFQFFSRLAMSAGLKWQYACSRAYTAM